MRRPRSASASRPRSWASASTNCSTASRARSPAGSSSGWPSPARSCATRSCSCSTSRSPTWTPSCARRRASRSSRLLNRFRITAIYVTHDQIEAMALGDRIAVMRDGRIEQVGTYETLREDPDNAFVAGFLGPRPMNLLQRHGRQRRRAARRRVGRLAALWPSGCSSAAGRRITLGVHADDAVAYDPRLPDARRPACARARSR